ncbi:MAG: hypothetical protein M0R03_12495 [Novosphingobium sp.]|nr:hypothetical protein [Novosphingobium sp.]
MTQINKYNFTESEIKSFVIDETNAQYLWIAFSLNDGVCNLKKVSAHKPDQVYFSIDLSVTEIKKVISSGNYVYACFDDDSLICTRFSKTNPITSTVDFSIPAGITEAPVDMLVSGSYIYFLTPGNISGENAKIVKFSLTGIFQETIDLATVTNAKAFTMDALEEEFWIITYKTPSEYIRLYLASGDIWTYSVNT